MKGAWAIRLALEDAGALASLRLVPGVEVSVRETEIWARCQHHDESLDATLRGLPVVTRYAWLEEDLLIEEGRRIPSGTLPPGPWTPINQWMVPRLPLAASAYQFSETQQLSLKRSTVETPANLLLTSLQDWISYASTVSEIRLAQLTFAVNDQEQTLIRGNPLPPLPGQRWTEVEGVGIPLGYEWHPTVSPTTLARVWGTSPHRLVLWHPDGRAEWIQSEQFIPASRTNVRASCPPQLLAP